MKAATHLKFLEQYEKKYMHYQYLSSLTEACRPELKLTCWCTHCHESWCWAGSMKRNFMKHTTTITTVTLNLWPLWTPWSILRPSLLWYEAYDLCELHEANYDHHYCDTKLMTSVNFMKHTTTITIVTINLWPLWTSWSILRPSLLWY